MAVLKRFSFSLDFQKTIEKTESPLRGLAFTCLVGNLIVWARSAVKVAGKLAVNDGFSESRPAALTAYRLRKLKKI